MEYRQIRGQEDALLNGILPELEMAFLSNGGVERMPPLSSCCAHEASLRRLRFLCCFFFSLPPRLLSRSFFQKII